MLFQIKELSILLVTIAAGIYFTVTGTGFNSADNYTVVKEHQHERREREHELLLGIVYDGFNLTGVNALLNAWMTTLRKRVASAQRPA